MFDRIFDKQFYIITKQDKIINVNFNNKIH